jgi:hypothetical protein
LSPRFRVDRRRVACKPYQRREVPQGFWNQRRQWCWSF